MRGARLPAGELIVGWRVGSVQSGFRRARKRSSIARHHKAKRAIGRCRNGTSAASRSRPSGSIQAPSTGRNENMPPAMSAMPAGSRTSRESGWRNHLRAAASRAGNSCSMRLKARRSSCLADKACMTSSSSPPRKRRHGSDGAASGRRSLACVRLSRGGMSSRRRERQVARACIAAPASDNGARPRSRDRSCDRAGSGMVRTGADCWRRSRLPARRRECRPGSNAAGDRAHGP